MTDKQIIIGGIDVSGCECIIEDYQRANNFEGRYEHIKNVCELGERGAEYYNLFCKDNPNCYYKQLKRKEQECEELKDKLNCRFCYPIMKIDNPENFKLCQETDCFRRQLDQLKKQLESTKGLVTVGNKQLAEALKENKELKKILHYPKYRNEEGIKELKTKSIDYLIEEIVGNHQYMEGKSQAVYKPMLIENKKLKQTLAEIKEIAIFNWSDKNMGFMCNQILQKINECEIINE